jgi:ABC-type nitrate/sulfonate/bicarbonate transport system substrate-binding protein
VAPTPASTRLQTLRIELPADVDVADLPRMMAADTLREQGYTVEALDFQDNALSVQALSQGEVDFSFAGTGIAWKAIQEGAKIASLLDGSLNQASLVVTSNIRQCSDLDGKRVVVPSVTSNRALFLSKYIEKNCPAAKIEQVVIASQNNSLIAMTSGQVDGAVIDYSAMLAFEKKENAGIHALVRFLTEFPGLSGAHIVTRRDLLEQHPEVVQDFIRASLSARTRLQDPQVFEEQLVKYLKLEPDEAKASLLLFSPQDLWSMDGGLTTESIQINLDFLEEAGSIEPGLKPTDVADLAPLDAVLAELGRK